MSRFLIVAATVSLLGVVACSLSPVTPASVRLQLDAATRSASYWPGSRAPTYENMGCYLIRAYSTSSADQISTSVTRGRSITCLDLKGQFLTAVNRSQIESDNSVPVTSGENTIEFLGIKSPLGDCSGKTLSQVWDAGDPEIYSLAKYQGSLVGGETLSVPLTYASGSATNRVAACETLTPTLGPARVFGGLSGTAGIAALTWGPPPGSGALPMDGLGSPMLEIPSPSFPIIKTYGTFGPHAQLDFLVPAIGGIGSITLQIKGVAGTSGSSRALCSDISSNATVAQMEIGLYSSYSGSWNSASAVSGDLRTISYGSSILGYSQNSIGGSNYFHLSARAIQHATGGGTCSYLKVNSVVIHLSLYDGRGGNVFHVAPDVSPGAVLSL